MVSYLKGAGPLVAHQCRSRVNTITNAGFHAELAMADAWSRIMGLALSGITSGQWHCAQRHHQWGGEHRLRGLLRQYLDLRLRTIRQWEPVHDRQYRPLGPLTTAQGLSVTRQPARDERSSIRHHDGQ